MRRWYLGTAVILCLPLAAAFGPNLWSGDKGKHTGDEVIAMIKYVMEQRAEKAKDMVAAQDQKRLNGIQLNFIQRKMGELGRGSGRVERDAIIVVDRTAGKGGTIRLNYLVG